MRDRWRTDPPRDGQLLPRTWNSRYPSPHFVRSIPGPDTEYELYGGRLRIVGVEVYDTMVGVGWRAAPKPDVAAVFVYHTMVRMRQRALPLRPTDPAVKHAHDVERNGGWPTEETRGKLRKHLALMLHSHIGLADDVGTVYADLGGGNQDGKQLGCRQGRLRRSTSDQRVKAHDYLAGPDRGHPAVITFSHPSAVGPAQPWDEVSTLHPFPHK